MYKSPTSYRLTRWSTVNRWRRWPRFISALTLLTLFAGQAFCQSAGTSLFKLSIAKSQSATNSQEWNPSSVTLRGVRALDIVTFVHRVNPAYIFGGEKLLNERFDVDYQSTSLSRSMGEGIIMDSVLRMLGMRVVLKQMDVDVVIIDKPRKLGPAIWASYEANSSITIGSGSTVGHTTMEGLGLYLEKFYNRPVIDRTKMIGLFKWELAIQQGIHENELTAEIKNKLGLDMKFARERMSMYVVEPVETEDGKS
ncbi:MAG: DUF3738 domain-containing protein [Fimbriimonadaceae bacterium]|nr:DUF3738 domain-containing protein [Fimbriimonadaceae bacterium]